MAWTFRKHIHEIDKTGNLYYLLNAFIGAYNRRTDIMERAVKLDERIADMRQKLDAAGNELKAAVDNNQPNS
jgi:hypothetical protein